MLLERKPKAHGRDVPRSISFHWNELLGPSEVRVIETFMLDALNQPMIAGVQPGAGYLETYGFWLGPAAGNSGVLFREYSVDGVVWLSGAFDILISGRGVHHIASSNVLRLPAWPRMRYKCLNVSAVQPLSWRGTITLTAVNGNSLW